MQVTGIVKKLDRLLGPLAASIVMRLCPSPPWDEVPQEPKAVLFIRPGGIGDAVLLLPAIRVLKEANPELIIDVLAEKRNVGIFSLSPDVSNVLCYDRLPELWRAIRGKYDLIIDTEQWHRLSAVVARLAGAPFTLGYGSNDRRRLFSHCVSYDQGKYEAESFFDLVVVLGASKPDIMPVPFLEVPLETRARAEEILFSLADKTFVALFPGASIPERRWGGERFRALAICLQEKGFPVVLIGGAADQREGEEIVADGLGLNLAGRTSLPETAAIIKRSSLLVSGDSGLLHIGVGLGKPTVSLFGPGIAKKWAPRGENHIVVNKDLSCSPCTRFGCTPKCPIDAQCMKDITVDEVFSAVMALLEKKRNQKAS